MPSTSEAQRRFMRAAAHNPQLAAKADIPQSVAREFVSADEAQARRRRVVEALVRPHQQQKMGYR